MLKLFQTNNQYYQLTNSVSSTAFDDTQAELHVPLSADLSTSEISNKLSILNNKPSNSKNCKKKILINRLKKAFTKNKKNHTQRYKNDEAISYQSFAKLHLPQPHSMSQFIFAESYKNIDSKIAKNSPTKLVS